MWLAVRLSERGSPLYSSNLQPLQLRQQLVVPLVMVVVRLKTDRRRARDIRREVVDEERLGRLDSKLPRGDLVDLAVGFGGAHLVRIHRVAKPPKHRVAP